MWQDVLIPVHVVASNGFEAEVGGEVALAFELGCTWRTAAPDRVSSVTCQQGSYDIVGRAVPIETGWPHGWVLDVDGLAVYVSELGSGGRRDPGPRRESGSDPVLPLPSPGAWVRARGRIGIAEDHVVDGFEPSVSLLSRATRRWTVHGIRRLTTAHVADPVEITAIGNRHRLPGRQTLGYLLDLDDVG